MKIPGFIFLLILFLVLATGDLYADSSLHCTEQVQFPETLNRSPVGVERVSSQPLNLRAFFPYPENTFVFSMNDNKLAGIDGNFGAYIYPVHFLLGDGTLDSPFIEVDLRKGSKLQICLQELANQLDQQLQDQGLEKNQENILQALRTFMSHYLTDEKNISLPGSSDPGPFQKELELPPGQNIQRLENVLHPIIPLELYLKLGEGVCLQKALFTSLLMKLEQINIDHQIRMGGTATTGHTWIELADGRHLDPTWNLLERENSSGDYWESWFEIGGTQLFRYRTFPYSILQLAEP